MQTQTPTPLPEGFVAGVQAPATENLPATPLVYIAYGGIWLVLLLYVLLLWRKLQRIDQDLKQLPAARPGVD